MKHFYPYSSRFLHRHWGNPMIAPVPVKQPWIIWTDILQWQWNKPERYGQNQYVTNHTHKKHNDPAMCLIHWLCSQLSSPVTFLPALWHVVANQWTFSSIFLGPLPARSIVHCYHDTSQTHHNLAAGTHSALTHSYPNEIIHSDRHFADIIFEYIDLTMIDLILIKISPKVVPNWWQSFISSSNWFSTKPLPKPVLTYSKSNFQRCISVQF